MTQDLADANELVVVEKRGENLRRRRYSRSRGYADAEYVAERHTDDGWKTVGSDEVDELVVNGERVFGGDDG